MGNLDGKVAVVTGATRKRSLGRAFADRLARDGANIVVSDLEAVPKPFLPEDFQEEWKGLQSIVSEIEAMGRKALAVVADVTKPEDVDNLLKKSVEKFGKVDIVVNAAGLAKNKGQLIIDTPFETWNQTIAVNLTGTFLVCKAFAKQMIAQGSGKIINIASVTGKMGYPGNGSYSASKFGVVGLTQSLSLELAKYKINVNAVCPGVADTDLARVEIAELSKSKGISVEKAREEFLAPVFAAVPFGRPAKVEEIASVVSFLASEESSWITGQAINVNGGALVAH